MTDELSFFQRALVHLTELKADQKPEWGTMSAQEMVEHLVGTWRISNGNAEVNQYTSEEDAAERLEFLRNDVPFAKNIKNPIFKNGLPPLRKSDLSAAIDQLKEEMEEFDRYFEAYPDAKPTHPIFGPLDRIDWLRFQEKHMLHHLRQFNLM